MNQDLNAQRKELLAELDLAQQAFAASHAQLAQSLRATEAGEKPPRPLPVALHQHVTTTSILLAVGRALAGLGKRAKAVAKRKVGASQGRRKARTPAFA